MIETAVPLNEVPPQELGSYSAMAAPTPALGGIRAGAQGSAGAYALVAPKPAGAYLYHHFQQRAQTPAAQSVSSPRLQGAALLPYVLAPEGQDTLSLSDSMPSYPSTESFAAASNGVPFAKQESMAMAGRDAGREDGAAVAERVEEERGQGQLRAANSLLHLLNMSPGYVAPQ